MDEFVYDSIGNAHVRKNLYLKDKALGAKVDKNNHPYMKKLDLFLNKEKEFLKNLKIESNNKKNEYKKACDSKETKFRIELLEAKAKKDFYHEFVELSYDAELEYFTNKLKAERLPGIIDLYVSTICEKESLVKKLNSLNKEEDEKAKKIFEGKKEELKKELEKNKEKLKQSRDEGNISDKAYKEEISQLNLH